MSLVRRSWRASCKTSKTCGRRSSGRALFSAAGLRNRLVHECERIDDATVLALVPTARRQFTEYVRQVESYLHSREEPPRR